MKNLYLLISFFYSLGCFSQTTPIEIKFDPENMKTSSLGLSDFVESVEYILLETKDKCLIGKGMVFDYDDAHIVVKYNDAEAVYLFDRKGRLFLSVSEKKEKEEIKVKGSESAIQAFKNFAKKVDPEDNPIIMILKLNE